MRKTTSVDSSDVNANSDEIARLLIARLYEHGFSKIPQLEVAQLHRPGSGALVGGDLTDVYHYDNGSTSFAVADISGRGIKAATHAALVKYGMRAYASHGLTAEETLRSLNTLYIENSGFEDLESFVSVFFGIIDPERKVLNYASAGHEPVVLFDPHEVPLVLAPTGPLIGLDDDRRKFTHRFIPLSDGTTLAMFTDGVTEARSDDGSLFGIGRAVDVLARNQTMSLEDQAQRLLQGADDFSHEAETDDVAILLAKITKGSS